MNPRLTELFRNSLLFTIANLGSKILVFVMVPFYTTVLTSAEYGDANIIQTTSNLLYPILTVLCSEAVLRFCFIDNKDKQKILYIGLLSVGVATIMSYVLLGLYLLIVRTNVFCIYIYLIPPIIFAHALSRVMHCYCRGIERVKTSAIAGVIQTIVIVLTNILLLLYFKIGVLGYLASFIIADIIASIYMVCAIKAWHDFSLCFDKKLCYEMINYSWPLVPNQISWWVVGSINQYIILAFLGASAVGIYSATLRIPSILTVLSDIFAQAWLLSALKNYGSDESKRFIRNMYNNFFACLVMLTSIIIIFAYPLSRLLLKNSFSDYWYIIPFLFVSVFLGAITGFVGSVYSAERKNRIQAVSTLIGAVIIIALSLILIQRVEVIGVAISTVIGYYVILLIRQVGIKKYIILDVTVKKITVYSIMLCIESIFVFNESYLLAFSAIAFIGFINRHILFNIILTIFREVRKQLR